MTQVIANESLAEPTSAQASPASGWVERAASIDQLKWSDPVAALELAESWVQEERARGVTEGYALAARSHAHALRFLGRYDEAVTAYEAAEAAFESLGLDLEAGRTRIGHVTALRFLGRYEDALALALSSRDHFLANGHELEAAKQSNNLGTVYRPMGNLEAALAAYRVAAPIFRRLGERSSLADIEQNIGNVLVDLGRYEEALTHLKSAERIRRALGMRAQVALTLLNIGILSYRRGEYGDALQSLTEARRIYESLGFERGMVAVDQELIPVYVTLNLTHEASVTAASAVAGLRHLNMPFELGQALLSAGQLASVAGDREAAQAMAQEARELLTATGSPLWQARTDLLEAEILLRNPSEADLRRASSVCRRAARVFKEAGTLDRAAEGYLLEGVFLAYLGRRDDALVRIQQARAIADELGANHLRLQVETLNGDLIAGDDLDEAIACYRRALTYLEELREGARAVDAKVSFLADKADLYQRAVGLLLTRETPERIAEAYRIVESSKSRSLLEEIAERASGRRDHARPEIRGLLRRVHETRARLNAAYARAFGINGLRAEVTSGGSEQMGQLAALERDLAELTRELQLAARSDGAREMLADGGPGALPAGTTLLEYYTVGDRLLAFVRTGDRLTLRHLGPVAPIEELIATLNLQIRRVAVDQDRAMATLPRLRRGADACLQALWQQLIAPLSDELATTEHLVIVPHGLLHGLPFHALLGPDGYLADQRIVSYAPSASILEACLHAPATTDANALFVGVDEGDLPWVRREISMLTEIWPEARVRLGKRATRGALARQAGHSNVFHLASHAIFRGDNPSFSSVKLADGWLTAGDLGDLVRGASLVTLAACETGVSGVAAGDEVLGFTRGLLAAGCAAVVVSLWQVSDRTTSLLMPGFYQRLRAGMGPSEALRGSMHDVRADHDHPYFWAPFVVVGNGRDPVAAPPSDAPTPAAPAEAPPSAHASSAHATV